MSDFKPGSVAMVTYDGERKTRAVRGFRDTWAFWDDDHWTHVRASVLSDITPLVVLELTREDADLLQGLLSGGQSGETWNLLVRLREAVREQTPAPEPPKRWTVGPQMFPGNACEPLRRLFIDGNPTQIGGKPAVIQRYADALNAVEDATA